MAEWLLEEEYYTCHEFLTSTEIIERVSEDAASDESEDEEQAEH